MLQRDVVRFHSFHRIIRFDHQKGPETRNHVYGEIYMQRTGSRTLSSACDRLAFYVATEKKVNNMGRRTATVLESEVEKRGEKRTLLAQNNP